VIAEGTGFTAVMLGGSTTVVLLFLMNAIFRGAGDAATAMRNLWLANALNIALGPCFIFGLGPFPELGVVGAAVGTTIGRGAGVTFQLAMLLRGNGRIQLRARHLRVAPDVMLSLLRISIPGVFQTLVESASWLGLMRILSTFGDAAVAGYTIAIRVLIFALLPSWGVANAAATLVGQNLGAGEPERAAQSVRLAAVYNIVFLGLVGGVFVAIPGPIVRLFEHEPEVIAYGVDCLRIVAVGFLFYGYGMVAVQGFNGAGDTVTPTVLNLICFWLFKIPGAWVLAVGMGLGPRGVFIAVTAAYTVYSLLAGWRFRIGNWKHRKV
jgi:putative MATE family efflux protein